MISLLVINYRSAALTANAIASARRAASSPLEVVVVDNSCDPAEAAALEPLADVLVVSERNLGYAGGINAGRRRCRGESLVIANPDVEFGAGAIDHLVAALDDAEVSGPRLTWDREGRWLLPPGDLTSAWEKVDAILASRSPVWMEQRDRRRTRGRIAFWSAERPTRVPLLSGAILCLRAADLDRFGAFDERFRLYFEETDFLRRVRAQRGRVVYVPAARCRHIYNQSAGQEPAAAAERFAESELRYLEKWNGPLLARLLKRFERRLPDPPVFPPVPTEFILDRDGLLVEASPLPTFVTAAGHFPEGRQVTLPAEILESLRDASLHLRSVDRATGEVVSVWTLDPTATPSNLPKE